MKQFLLAAALIAVPVAAFSAFQIYVPATETASAAVSATPSLGDLSPLKAIVTDVQAIAAKGDLVAAEKRITDFESAWDEAESKLRPLNKTAWGNVDEAADGAIHALRAKTPDTSTVTSALTSLNAALDNPDGAAAQQDGAKLVSGIAVTDASGHNIPCEEMLVSLQAALVGGKVADANKSAAAELQGKATERCNADDDAHANAFSAQALALANQ